MSGNTDLVPDLVNPSQLQVAACLGDLQMVEALLASKADPNARDGESSTPLHYANFDPRIAAALIAAGADLEAQDGVGQTPIFYGVQVSNCDVIGCLLAAKANVDPRDPQGTTPLHVAAEQGSTDEAKLLVENKADPFAKDCLGNTPLQKVSEHSPETYALLEQAMVDWERERDRERRRSKQAIFRRLVPRLYYSSKSGFSSVQCPAHFSVQCPVDIYEIIVSLIEL